MTTDKTSKAAAELGRRGGRAKSDAKAAAARANGAKGGRPRTVHFSAFGVSLPPTVADRDGYIKYRDGYEERLPREKWTAAEVWIDDQERAIRRAR